MCVPMRPNRKGDYAAFIVAAVAAAHKVKRGEHTAFIMQAKQGFTNYQYGVRIEHFNSVCPVLGLFAYLYFYQNTPRAHIHKRLQFCLAFINNKRFLLIQQK